MLPINTSTVLLDTSSAREDEPAVDAELDKAHVIILVYDVNNAECIRRLKTNWLPRIAKVNDRVSLLLFIILRYR
jgi:GTPase SAR1 family protein